jgi:hypothetical protein
MAKLSRTQLESLAKGAGFPDAEVPTIVGIAFAESGGDPQAHNPVPPDNSYGLLQINMIGSLGINRRKQFKLANNEALFDPATNFKVGKAIRDGSGFGAWTTYTSGKYKRYMDEGSEGKIVDLTPDVSVPNPISGVTNAINAFGSTLFKASSNMAAIGIAIALIVIGTVLLARNQIGAVLPAKKALKIAKGLT